MTSSGNSVTAVQKSAEMLLVGSSSCDPYSALVVDPRTGVSVWSYKGSELQGATIGLVRPLGNAGEHIIVSMKDIPLMHVLAVRNRDRFHTKTVVSGAVDDFCTTADGSLLFVAIRTKIHVYLLTTGEFLSTTDSHLQTITRICLSTDGSLLISTSNDGDVHVYLVADMVYHSADRAVEPLRKWRAHTHHVLGLAVSSGTNPRIASCGEDHVLTVHSISLDACLLKVSADHMLTACAFDPAESRLFVGTKHGNIAQLNLYAMTGERELLIQTTDEQNEKVPVFKGHSDEIKSLTVNGDGSMLASGDSTGRYCIWDIVSRQCLKVSSMRGAVLSLQFVPNWPSLTSNDIVNTKKPVFELQRNRTEGKKLAMIEGKLRDRNTEYWHSVADGLIDRLLFEMQSGSGSATKSTSSNGNHTMSLAADAAATSSKKTKKRKQAEPVEEEDVEVIEEEMENEQVESEESSSTADKATIKKLQEEVNRLKRINNELFNFAAKELIEPDDNK